jgi:hypothetical protein
VSFADELVHHQDRIGVLLVQLQRGSGALQLEREIIRKGEIRRAVERVTAVNLRPPAIFRCAACDHDFLVAIVCTTPDLQIGISACALYSETGFRSPTSAYVGVRQRT